MLKIQILNLKLFYHKWIKEQKKLILPIKEFKKSNLYYDITMCSYGLFT